MAKVHERVQARVQITEGGKEFGGKAASVAVSDSQPLFGDPHYIHAEAGEWGTVAHINEKGLPTVCFDRTGTATIVGWDELEAVS